MKKDIIGVALGFLGIAIFVGGLIYGAYLIHPILAVIIAGIAMVNLANAILKF